MNILKIIGRIIVGFFIVVAGLQTTLAVLRMVAIFRSSSAGSDATSAAVVYFAVSFAMLVLFLWLFRKLEKSKSRWGWGWFILLLSYSSWYNKAAVKPNAISGILVPVVMFVCYFQLRTRMIGMFSKLWKVSFVAGIISLFVGGFLMAILLRVGI